MAKNSTVRRGLRSRKKPDQKPVKPGLFWISMIATGLCAGAIVWTVITGVPKNVLGLWPRALILALFMISVISSLAVTEVIPWGRTSWAEWRKPKVLGAVAGLMIGAVGLIAGIGPLFNPPAADQQTQIKIQQTVNTTEKKIDRLTAILRRRFPDDPPILKEIVGRWGDLTPECEVVWDIDIVQRGTNAALIAQTVKAPGATPQYRLVAEIIAADNDTLHVQGVEPAAALGSSARFDLNRATQRLTWDDRVRGSGGVEVYRRCA